MQRKREQAQLDEDHRVRAMLKKLGIDPHAKIEWPKQSSSEHGVVVARIGDRTFYAPEVCRLFTHDRDGEWQLQAEVGIVDGHPLFRQIMLRPFRPLSPLEVQRLPWSKLAEAAIESNAVEDVAGKRRRAKGREVRNERVRAKRRRSYEPMRAPSRTPVTHEKLDEIMKLREEAQRKGLRWDTYAAERLNYTPAYLRKLAGRASREHTKRKKGKR